VAPAHPGDPMSTERLAELVRAASYGTVLVLAALSAIGVSDVALGHGSELVAGVGLATWLAHLFAELLGGQVHRDTRLGRREVRRAMADGSPILVSTVLPALVLLLGRLDLVADGTARIVAIAVGVLQLAAIGAFVGRVAPARPGTVWAVAGVTVAAGIAVVAVTVALGH
jgi:hypothetical protein